jgi:fructose-bisphosphate aldolase class I
MITFFNIRRAVLCFSLLVGLHEARNGDTNTDSLYNNCEAAAPNGDDTSATILQQQHNNNNNAVITSKQQQQAMMMDKIMTGEGFLAALDQSGGSTPKALQLYGFPTDLYTEGETSMFDAVHQVRTRIVTSPSFRGDRILGAILFEDTMERQVVNLKNGLSTTTTAEYLWKEKQIVPFLKVDKGLLPEENGVQLMKPMPELNDLLQRAKEYGIFGTKMRSVIKSSNANGIQALVRQQFEVGQQIIDAGLVPILEPEVDIHSPDKEECEELLKACILEQLDQLRDDDRVMLKVSLPSVENVYQECMEHPKCIRVVALSGGYSRDEATEILWKQKGMIASFSRALTEGLNHDMSDEEFDEMLDQSIATIFAASKV